MEPNGGLGGDRLSSAALGNLEALSDKVLELSDGVLGLSWAALGVSWRDLGGSWVALVAILGAARGGFLGRSRLNETKS